MKRLWIMPVTGIVAILFSGCENFRVVGNPTHAYTTNYNYPGLRIVPYNDSTVEYKAYREDVKVCSGIPSKKGFHCP